MNAEHLQDAISLLPEEMLQDVDQLRRRKRNGWKGIIAAAACLCVLVGLWSLGNGGIKAESGSAAPDRYHESNSIVNSNDGTNEESAIGNSQPVPMAATVLEVQDDRIYVYPIDTPPLSHCLPITVMLTELEDTPTLEKNQRIRIYYSEKTDPLIPYKIEIIDE